MCVCEIVCGECSCLDEEIMEKILSYPSLYGSVCQTLCGSVLFP